MANTTDTPARLEFFGTPPAKLAAHLGGSGRAQIPWRLLRAGEDPFAGTDLPNGARQRLAARCLGMPVAVAERRVASCGTTKLRLRLRDAATVEMVIIPNPRRSTVCVSCQVGCARDCQFCLTGRCGLLRSLSAAEMVAQVCLALFEVKKRGLAPLRNVVWMGMGEPLDNLDQVRRAIAILTDHHALGIGPSRITLSTIGPSPQTIQRAAKLRVRLAWSLHTADEAQRRRLIPGSKHFLAELRAAFVGAVAQKDADLFVEVTLIQGLNDSTSDAERLCRFLAPFGGRIRVNLLPLNPGRGDFFPASDERSEAFRALLHRAGVRCIIRRPRGIELGAACGQLAGSFFPNPMTRSEPWG